MTDVLTPALRTPAEPGLRWRRRARPLLGTVVEVAAVGAGEQAFFRASDRAFAVVARYHAAMSFHEAASDVRAIAAASAGTTLQIAPDTWAVIAAALAFEADSGGVFDVAVADELVARGLLPSICAGVALERVAARTALRLEEDGRVTVLQPVRIDLGGIAKGAAVDAALAELRAAGVAAAVVNAGGDLATYGAPAQPIAVRGPDGVVVQAGSLADGAIATSGPFVPTGASSLVVRGGRSARWGRRAVTVVAPICLVADALTKVVAVVGEAAAPLLRRYDAQAFSVDAAGRFVRVE